MYGLYIYGHGGHVGHVTTTISIKFGPLDPLSLIMKFDFTWLDLLQFISGFGAKAVLNTETWR